jgi:nitroimidazol reductase NimA-like FMN-containing flavoprotein (pyridoxamine 5'-phosphate oxidase superfamily)
MADFEPTERTTLKRRAERGSYDRETVHAILDEGFMASVAATIDGWPYVQPMLYARDGERIILHGSAKNRLLNHLRTGAPVCLNVTLIDGLVLGRSVPDHSVNYRSVTVFGTAKEILGFEAKRSAMNLVFDSLISGRWEHLPPVPKAYLEQGTIVFEVALAECVAKIRTGPPESAPVERGHPIWAGVVPFFLGTGTPVPDPQIPADEAQQRGPAEQVRNYKRPQRKRG